MGNDEGLSQGNRRMKIIKWRVRELGLMTHWLREKGWWVGWWHYYPWVILSYLDIHYISFLLLHNKSPTFSSLKQRNTHFYPTVDISQESGPSLGGAPLLRVIQVWKQRVGWPVFFLSGGSTGENLFPNSFNWLTASFSCSCRTRGPGFSAGYNWRPS